MVRLQFILIQCFFFSQQPVATIKVRIVVKTIEATITVSQNRFKGGFERVDHTNLGAVKGDRREVR